MRVWGWGPGEESWLIDRQIIMGRHDDEATLVRVDEAINKTYPRKNGVEMSVSRICWDIGGIDPTIVYNRSKAWPVSRDRLKGLPFTVSPSRICRVNATRTAFI